LRDEKEDLQMEAALKDGESVLRRIQEGASSLCEATATYRRWVKVLQALPINPDGTPEEIAGHFLRLGRHEEALMHFRRVSAPATRSQVELGLEILARLRYREEYAKLLSEHGGVVIAPRPDFANLNQSVRVYSKSVVWIRQQAGAGSGFTIGQNEIATTRHVLIDPTTGQLVTPDKVQVVAKEGTYRVASIRVPINGPDDVAILRLAEETKLVPLRLGFSELVEVGERIMTLGFPSPGTGGFDENLYCNAGLVNRIRSSELCSERVLEVSLELQGGISGAPILNEMGEVVGLVAFTQVRAQAIQGGHVQLDRSFYAIPVEVLRRLRTEISS